MVIFAWILLVVGAVWVVLGVVNGDGWQLLIGAGLAVWSLYGIQRSKPGEPSSEQGETRVTERTAAERGEYCLLCGEVLPDQAAFCPGCGGAVKR